MMRYRLKNASAFPLRVFPSAVSAAVHSAADAFEYDLISRSR